MDDYASELLGSKTDKVLGSTLGYKEEAGQFDYAGALLNAPKKKAPVRDIDQLPIANKDSNEGTADFTTLTKGKIVDDPATRLKIYAKDLFPDMAESEAMERIGMVDDEIVYLGTDDKLYRASPEGIIGKSKDLAAGAVANAPGIVMSTIGGTAGLASPVPGGTVMGASLGAAGGEGIRKSIANLVFDEPQTVEGNLKSMGTEAAFAGTGTMGGKLYAKLRERGMAKDIDRLDQAKTQELAGKAGRAGIQLTPAETTNLPSLKAQQKNLAGHPRSADAMDEFATTRAGQVRESVDRYLKSVSGVDDLEQAGALARTGANKAIDKTIEERAKAAKPLYDAAFSKFEQFSDGLRMQNPGGAAPKGPHELNAVIRRMPIGLDSSAKKLAKVDGIDLSDPKNSLKGLHYMKLALDDQIRHAMTSTSSSGPMMASRLTNLQKDFLKQIDALSPDYAEARSIYAHFSPSVKAIEDSPIARLAELKDDKLFTAASRMFNAKTTGPLAVSQARHAIEPNDPAAWQAIKRAFIQEKFEEAGQLFATSRAPGRQAGQFFGMFGGNPRQMAIMKEALSPAEFQAFKDLQDVLEAATRVTDTNSDTVFKNAMEQQMANEAHGMVIRGVEGARSLGKSVLDRIKDHRMGKYADEKVKIITSPDGMAKLRELKKLAPNDKKWIQGVSALLGVSASPGVPGVDDPILPAPLSDRQ